MNFLKRIINKKVATGALVGIFAIFLASTHVTHASIFSLTDISGGVISFVAFTINTLIAAVAGIFIAVEAWIIAVVLNINDGVFQSTFVQTGFSITLALSNLAFVLGIIVIAIATILRSQSYGIKKLLWKLVVAAILVNFGLVIAAPIFGLGNSLTHYFLNCIDPTAGGCTTTSSGFTSYSNFATSFAGAFHPENNFATVQNSSISSTGTTQNNVKGAFSAMGTEFGKTFVPVFGILFTVVNLITIVVVLLAFIILLLIRYLYIAILAIIMPFAWASWVFPGLDSHWKKWWNKFLQWTFFSPIVLFFIYLAMLMMKGQAASGGMRFDQYQSGSIFTALGGFLGSEFTPIITAFLQEFVFVGLIIGGMVVASSMSITGAKAAVSAATGAAKATATWGLKKGARGALKTGARMTQPKIKTAEGGGQYMDINRKNKFLGTISTRLQGMAESKALESKGLMASVYEGTKNGSGLFKKKGKGGGDKGGGGGAGGGRKGGGGGKSSAGGGGATAAGFSTASGRGATGPKAELSPMEKANSELDAQGFGGGPSILSDSEGTKPELSPKEKAAAEFEAMAARASQSAPASAPEAVKSNVVEMPKRESVSNAAPTRAAAPEAMKSNNVVEMHKQEFVSNTTPTPAPAAAAQAAQSANVKAATAQLDAMFTKTAQSAPAPKPAPAPVPQVGSSNKVVEIPRRNLTPSPAPAPIPPARPSNVVVMRKMDLNLGEVPTPIPNQGGNSANVMDAQRKNA